MTLIVSFGSDLAQEPPAEWSSLGQIACAVDLGPRRE
jgi:hypothetical protein